MLLLGVHFLSTPLNFDNFAKNATQRPREAHFINKHTTFCKDQNISFPEHQNFLKSIKKSSQKTKKSENISKIFDIFEKKKRNFEKIAKISKIFENFQNHGFFQYDFQLKFLENRDFQKISKKS